MSLRKTIGIEESGDRNGFFRLFINHQRHAGAAVRMATAGELAPVVLRSVDQVSPVRKCGHEADREPVTDRLAETGLVLDVVREVRQCVALRMAAFVGNILIATGEGHRLEGEEVDLLGVVESELDDAANLLVIDAVDDTGDGNDVHAGLMQVVDGLKLHVEGVTNLAVAVRGVADSIELQVRVAQTRFGGSLREFLGLGELDAVGCGLHGGVTNLARVSNCVEEVGAQRGFATRKLHRHLTLGLDSDGVVEHGLDLVPRELMHETNLVGVHKAGVAHHVATVRQIDGEHRTTAVGHGRGAVIVKLAIVVGADIAARENLFRGA